MARGTSDRKQRAAAAARSARSSLKVEVIQSSSLLAPPTQVADAVRKNARGLPVKTL